MKMHDKTRREFIKKVAYVAPAVVTLAAIPSFASAGSARYPGNNYPGIGQNYPSHHHRR